MASGALIGFASFGVMVVQIIVGVRRQRADFITAILLLLMSIVMVRYVPHIAGHDVLKAHNVTEFFEGGDGGAGFSAQHAATRHLD